MTPTLIVGLGGRGARTLRLLKGLYLEIPEDDRVPAGFLAFDQVPPSQFGSFFSDLSSEEFFPINRGDVCTITRNLGGIGGRIQTWTSVLQWFPANQARLLASEDQAYDGYRPVGRLGFFSEDLAVEATIRRALYRLSQLVGALDLEFRIVLIGGLGGGAGTGMLLDTFYAVRRQHPLAEVSICLLLPDRCLSLTDGMLVPINAYACLKELHHLKAGRIAFTAEYERIAPVTVNPGTSALQARLFLFGARGASMEGVAEEGLATTLLAGLTRSLESARNEASGCLAIPIEADDHERYWCTASASLQELIRIDLGGSEFLSSLKQIYETIRTERRDADAGTERLPDVGTEGSSFPTVLLGRDASSLDVDSCAERWKERLNEPIVRLRDDWRNSALEDLKSIFKNVSERSHKDVPKEEQDAIIVSLDGYRAILMGKEAELLTALEKWANWHDKKASILNTMSVFLDAELKERKGREREEFLKILYKERAIFARNLPDGSTQDRNLLEEHWKAVDDHLIRLKRALWWMVDWVWRLRLRLLWEKGIRHKCALLLRLLKKPEFQSPLTKRFWRVASQIFDAELEDELAKIKSSLPDRPENDKPRKSIEPVRGLPSALQAKLRAWVQESVAEILTRGQVLPGIESEDPEVWRPALQSLFQGTEAESRWKRDARFLIDREGEDEARVRALVRECAQEVFIDPPLRPHRQASAFALVPQGLFWPTGFEGLAAFLDQECRHILKCGCNVVSYPGDRLWLYHEDRSNLPCEIRILKACQEAYRKAPSPELFHIDRRFLEDPAFTDLCDDDPRAVPCGNSGCTGSLAKVQRDTLVCPECHRSILSRCGNLGCRLDNLHLRTDGKAKSCPGCGGFNHAAWWLCRRHGKNPLAVPVDKERCPDCIRRHLDDPIRFPTDSIGVRPDLETVACPRCLASEKDPSRIFYVRRDLLPFYWNGVNGHDSAKMTELAKKYNLRDGYRCPNCETHLIPFHHHRRTAPVEEPLPFVDPAPQP